MTQDKDELLLKKRIRELADLCWQRDVKTYTGFLSLREQTVFHSLEKSLPPVPRVVAGGFEEAERKIVCFLPSYEDETAQLPIRILRAAPVNPRFSQTLTHRDYLGAIMSLGIDRSCVGDILMEENGCFIFCLEKMADYLCQELTMVRHTAVCCQLSGESKPPEPNRQEIRGSVASPRLDSVAALVFSCSRTRILPYIEGEKVFIDGRLVTSAGQQLKGGEIVSVRGLGKFRYVGTGKETKKGRIYVQAEKYC